MTPRVLNKRTASAGDVVGAVYVGRPSKWGNPFAIGPGRTRVDVVAQFRVWLDQQPYLIADAKRELRGKNLMCWCAPRECHADVWLAVANQED